MQLVGRPARGRRRRRWRDGCGGAGGPAPGHRPVQPEHREQAELEELPGIGPSLAQAIIAERDAHRRVPLASTSSGSVRGIGERRFADIKDLVTV